MQNKMSFASEPVNALDVFVKLFVNVLGCNLPLGKS